MLFLCCNQWVPFFFPPPGGRVDLIQASSQGPKAVSGIFIKHVLPTSPAGLNGTLKTGDRILEVRRVYIICENKTTMLTCYPWLLNLMVPDSKVHVAHMGPTWVLSPQVGPMLAPWTLLSGVISEEIYNKSVLRCELNTDRDSLTSILSENLRRFKWNMITLCPGNSRPLDIFCWNLDICSSVVTLQVSLTKLLLSVICWEILGHWYQPSVWGYSPAAWAATIGCYLVWCIQDVGLLLEITKTYLKISNQYV